MSCKKKPITAVLAMFLAKEVGRIDTVYEGDKKVKLAFVLPPTQLRQRHVLYVKPASLPV